MPKPPFKPVTIAQRDQRLREAAKRPFLPPHFEDWPEERAAAASFLGSVESAKTTATYGTVLRQWFDWCDRRGVRPFDATRKLAKEYLVELAHLAPMSRMNRCVGVRSFYNHVLDDDDAPIDRNPFERVKPKNPRPRRATPALEQTTFDELLAWLGSSIAQRPDLLYRQRDFAMIYLMGRLGPRAITTSHLTWGSLRSDGGVARLSLHLKGDRYEEVEVPTDVLGVLGGWYRVVGRVLGREIRRDDAMFPPFGVHATSLDADRIEPMSEDGISYIVRVRLSAIGVVGDRWSAHAMRATAATIAHENGASIEECQAMLCHLNRSQTEAYVRRRSTRSAAAHWRPVWPQSLAVAGASGPELPALLEASSAS